MSDTPTSAPDWNTPEGKLAIYRKVVKYLHENPAERERVLNYAYGREFVAKVAGITIPADASVLFLPEGDYAKGEIGSPSNADPAAANEPSASQPTANPPRASRRASARAGGGLAYNAGCSLIINLPPLSEDPDSTSILKYGCTYIIWDPLA